MNNHHRRNSFLFFLAALCCLLSCREDEPLASEECPYTCRLHLDETLATFGGETRASGGRWEQGDVIYLALDRTSGTSIGKATYSATTSDWTFTTDVRPAANASGTCRVYYASGSGVTPNSSTLPTAIGLTEFSALYASTSASYRMSDDVLYVTAHLKPDTWRMAFRGTAGTTVTLSSASDLSFRQQLTLSTGALSSQQKDLTLKVNANGYTDYFYATFTKSTSLLQITVGDQTYLRNVPNTLLAKGQTGYFLLPTSTDAHGWTAKGLDTDLSITLEGFSTDKSLDMNDPQNISLVTYGEEKSLDTADLVIDGHEAVDLGLSVKWATCNVGANSPEEYGLYFAWGETVGYGKDTSDGRLFNWSTYKWCKGSNTAMTKYCTDSQYGTVDNTTTLDLTDDAAHANWGGTWRMPTKEEQDELRTKCTWTWTTSQGVNGYRVTGKNRNSIFLPAAGCRHDSGLYFAGSDGCYWSSSLNASDSYYAVYLEFGSSDVDWYDDYRYRGQSVRAVCVSSE